MGPARASWAKSDWSRSHARWYSVPIQDNRLAPRVCAGELLILDADAKPEAGNIVALWLGSRDQKSSFVIGVLTALTATSASIRLDLAGDVAEQFILTADRPIHAAVGTMVRLDRPEDRANLAVNAAIRKRDRGGRQ